MPFLELSRAVPGYRKCWGSALGVTHPMHSWHVFFPPSPPLNHKVGEMRGPASRQTAWLPWPLSTEIPGLREDVVVIRRFDIIHPVHFRTGKFWSSFDVDDANPTDRRRWPRASRTGWLAQGNHKVSVYPFRLMWRGVWVTHLDINVFSSRCWIVSLPTLLLSPVKMMAGVERFLFHLALAKAFFYYF